MKTSSTTLQEDEFTFCIPTIRVFAPVSMIDEDGEQLFNQLEPFMVEQLQHVKDAVEAKFDNLRLGFDIT